MPRVPASGKPAPKPPSGGIGAFHAANVAAAQAAGEAVSPEELLRRAKHDHTVWLLKRELAQPVVVTRNRKGFAFFGHRAGVDTEAVLKKARTADPSSG